MEYNRRTVLKQMTISLAALSLPTWAHAWTTQTLKEEPNELLSALVNTIIPETDTPGAKTVGAHFYIQRMLKDCFDTKTQNAFEQGLQSINEQAQILFKKLFQQLGASEQVDLLKNISLRGSAEDKYMVQLLKKMALQAYTSSEYFLTTHRQYTIAPGFYHGCVPVKS